MESTEVSMTASYPQKCDTLQLTESQTKEIMQWADNNGKIISASFVPVFDEILLTVIHDGITFNIHAIEKDGLCKINVFSKLRKPYLEVQILHDDMQDGWMVLSDKFSLIISDNLKTTISKMPEEKQREFYSSAWTTQYKFYRYTSEYILYNRNNIIERPISLIQSNQVANKKSKSKKRAIKIIKTQYKIIGEINTSKMKGQKIIKCFSWSVRGHLRHYKSGKVSYVKPYTKGNKESFEEKKYKL